MSANVSMLDAAVPAASSVGDSLEVNQIYSTNHPAYQIFSDAVTEQLAVLADREAQRRSSARLLAIPFTLNSEEASGLKELYPEFEVVGMPLGQPVHAYWSAMRAAANEWCALSLQKFGKNFVHYGGSLLSSLVAGRRGEHIESNASDACSVHAAYAEAVAATRIFQDAPAVAKEYGVPLKVSEYDAYLNREAYGLCTAASVCTHQAPSMAVDLVGCDVSPQQVAVSMLQHGAEVCQGFFIYDPVMMVQDKGEFESTNVHFQRTDDSVHFHYPDGVSGVSSYSRHKWAKWCTSHYFTVGETCTNWFQLELMKSRGPFMFFRMVRVGKPVGKHFLSHALDFSDVDDYTLIRSWRLKNGFRSDPSCAADWVSNDFLMRSRVVRRVYEYVMQLQPEAFSRFAVKKQIRVVNNRWVVQGTTVAVTAALQSQQVEDLTTAIYARAFVDRYDSSRLSADMMSALKRYAAFSNATWLEKVRIASGAICTGLYNATLGKVDSVFRLTADYIVDYLNGGSVASARKVAMERAPTYVTFRSVVDRWSAVLAPNGERFCNLSDADIGLEADSRALGGVLAGALKRFSRRRSDGGSADAAGLIDVMRVVTDVADTSLGADEPVHREFSRQVAALNEVDQPASDRNHMEVETVQRRAVETVQSFRHGGHPDPAASLNQLYADVLPMMANTDVSYDSFSLSLDPQDRNLAAPYLRMPNYFGLPPTPRSYYVSKLRALSVPKRQNTGQELLSAMASRNMSAPAIALPQEDDVIIADIWDTFLKTACVDDAPAKLERFKADPVAMSDDALKDWASKAKPEVVERLRKEMEERSMAMGDKPVHEYLAMIKSDVKPTMSSKPVTEVTAPQVIVYHDKLLSALYSSIFRVLVRRFLSLLKPQYHVNLLKDTRDIEAFLTSVHPYDTSGLRYMENDFSKYDKSQSEFAFLLEQYVFTQLGMNAEMLDAWVNGHVECTLRSVSVGLSLHVMYQRKSGDATTAFGNVILNVLSVTYAYAGTRVIWAVFMGDDSIVCAARVAASDDSIQMLAEVFNLSAKFFVTDAPYFASNFVLVDGKRMQVTLVPDPVKRTERLSMHVSADDPQWRERWISYKDAMVSYGDPGIVLAVARAVSQRYEVAEGFVRDAAGALGTCAREYDKFRALWNVAPEVLRG